MVASLDGATAVAGGATGLSDHDDQALFRAFRAVADVVLVGAGTVRAESYGPVVLPDEVRRSRIESGRPAVPRLAVLSRRLDLHPDARFLDSENPPLILTGLEHSAEVRRALEGKAEVVVVDGIQAEPGQVLATLGANDVVLCEGGPSINGQLAGADLIDELNISTAPIVVGGPSPRLAHSVSEPASPLRFRLDRLLSGDRILFSRYLRDRSAEGG